MRRFEQADPSSIAVDSTGDVHVFERRNGRVHKFDSAGAWLGVALAEVRALQAANRSWVAIALVCPTMVRGPRSAVRVKPMLDVDRR